MHDQWIQMEITGKQKNVALGYGNPLFGEPRLCNLVYLEGKVSENESYKCSIPVPEKVVEYVRRGEQLEVCIQKGDEGWIHDQDQVAKTLGDKVV